MSLFYFKATYALIRVYLRMGTFEFVDGTFVNPGEFQVTKQYTSLKDKVIEHQIYDDKIRNELRQLLGADLVPFSVLEEKSVQSAEFGTGQSLPMAIDVIHNAGGSMEIFKNWDYVDRTSTNVKEIADSLFGPRRLVETKDAKEQAKDVASFCWSFDFSPMLFSKLASQGFIPQADNPANLVYMILGRAGFQHSILQFDKLHISTKLKKIIKNRGGQYALTLNGSFQDVLAGCKKKHRLDCWLHPPYCELLSAMHEQFYSASVDLSTCPPVRVCSFELRETKTASLVAGDLICFDVFSFLYLSILQVTLGTWLAVFTLL